MNQPQPTNDSKMNSQYQKLTQQMKQSASAKSDDVKDNPNKIPVTVTSTEGPMGHVSDYTKLLESLDTVSAGLDNINNDPMNDQVGTNTDSSSVNQDELINELNRLFTPVLIMQGFENDSSDQIKEVLSESGLLTEKSVIQFDNDTRMAQLIAICARLIQKQKNTENYQLFAKANKIKKQADLNMQKDEYDTAKKLAQDYLKKVSVENNSPVARDAANALLPATQH